MTFFVNQESFYLTFWYVQQFSVTVVICGSIMNTHSLQKLSMKLWKIITVHGFARNLNSSTFLIPSLVNRWTKVETENRFVPLTKEKKDRSSPCGTNKSSFISGLKFISMNINSIRGKKLELLAFLDFHHSATCCSYSRNQNQQLCCNFRTLPGNLPI